MARNARAGRALQRHLEHRIGAKSVGVDPVLVARGDHQHPKTQDVAGAVQGAGRIAGIIDADRKPTRHAEPPLYLPKRQKSRVRGQRSAVEPSGQRLAVHR
jgi:hypothetical protein